MTDTVDITAKSTSASINENQLFEIFLQTEISERRGPRGAVYKITPPIPAQDFLAGFEHEYLDEFVERLVQNCCDPRQTSTPLYDLDWALQEVEGLAENLKVIIDAFTHYKEEHALEGRKRFRVPVNHDVEGAA